MGIPTCKTLFQLAHLEQSRALDSSRKLTDQRNMFRHIPRQPPKFRIILHKPFHIGNTLNVRITLRLGLKMIHIFLDIGSQVAEIEVHVLRERRILVRREDYFAEFGTDVGHRGEGDAAVVDGEKIVDHGLVGPLTQERGDWIVATVKNKKYRRGIRLSEIEELFFRGHLVLYFRAESLGHSTIPFVPDE